MKYDWKGEDWDTLTEEERDERFRNRRVGAWQVVCEGIFIAAIFAAFILLMSVC